MNKIRLRDGMNERNIELIIYKVNNTVQSHPVQTIINKQFGDSMCVSEKDGQKRMTRGKVTGGKEGVDTPRENEIN